MSHVESNGHEFAVIVKPTPSPGTGKQAGMRIVLKVRWSALLYLAFITVTATGSHIQTVCHPQDLSFSVPARDNKKEMAFLLRDVSGFFEPSQMAALVRVRRRQHVLAGAYAQLSAYPGQSVASEMCPFRTLPDGCHHSKPQACA